VGLNYVSCSPFRVPIARLAAAHAAIKGKAGSTGAAKPAAKAAPKAKIVIKTTSKAKAKPAKKRALARV
jgi:pyruvate,orthophosphate dikinase